MGAVECLWYPGEPLLPLKHYFQPKPEPGSLDLQVRYAE